MNKILIVLTAFAALATSALAQPISTMAAASAPIASMDWLMAHKPLVIFGALLIAVVLWFVLRPILKRIGGGTLEIVPGSEGFAASKTRRHEEYYREHPPKPKREEAID
jgi:hypothetical protein